MAQGKRLAERFYERYPWCCSPSGMEFKRTLQDMQPDGSPSLLQLRDSPSYDSLRQHFSKLLHSRSSRSVTVDRGDCLRVNAPIPLTGRIKAARSGCICASPSGSLLRVFTMNWYLNYRQQNDIGNQVDRRKAPPT